MIKKANWSFLILVGLLLIGFVFRLWGLWQNSSFWVDEASSAGFARAIITRGVPVLATGYFPDNYLFHFYLMAASFKIFGLTEFAARLPSVVFGVLTILATYLLAQKITNKKVGLLAAVFMTFSLWEITMSRQARSYQTLQFFFLASIFFFYQVLDWFDHQKLRWWHLGVLVILIALTALTHMFGLILPVAFFIYLIFFRPDLWQRFWQRVVSLFPSAVLRFGVLVLSCGFFIILLDYLNFFRGVKEVIWNTPEEKFALFNHLKYYHSLLWRQYGLFSFLGFLGFVWLALKEFQKASLLLIILVIHFGLIFFRLPEAYTRYPFIIFPLILIFFSFALWQIWEWFFNSLDKKALWIKAKHISLFCLAFLVVLNGYKFTLRPKPFYSVNSEMREVPEPDFKSAYQYLLGKDPSGGFILVDTRPDAASWYLGEGYPSYYLGGEEKAVWLRLAKGFIRDEVSGAYYLTSRPKLTEIINQNKNGFVVLEEATVEYAKIDSEVINYIKNNLRKETRIDKIPGNKNGNWPIEIYSWGY